MNTWDKVFAERWEAHEEQNKQIINSVPFDFSTLYPIKEKNDILRVLEYGFGTGYFARYLRSCVASDQLRYYGVESSIIACHVAQMLQLGMPKEEISKKINNILTVSDPELPDILIGGVAGMSMYSTSFPSEFVDKFHYVFCSNVLEHFSDPLAVIKELFKYSNILYLIVPYNQSNLDQYHEEGGAGHVFSFNLKFFRNIPGAVVRKYQFFESPGWTWTRGSEDPLQLSIILEKI